MRHLAVVSLASALALAGGSEAGAAIRCVSPDLAACFDTIQDAVDAAAPGDTISIRGKRNRSAYNEAVTIATEDLTIQGQGASPTFRGLAETIEFGDLRAVDLADPDVQLWLDSYPDAQDFLDAVASLEALFEEDTLIDRCPPVVVEVCDTAETGPAVCGVDLDEGIPVFTVEADGTTFANLTIRHGGTGIQLGEGVTDTTIEHVCFRNNNAAVASIFVSDPDTDGPLPHNDGTTIRQSFVDGSGRADSFDLFGDDALIERNLLLNTDGIEVFGAGYEVSFNAVAVTVDAPCFRITGANGLVSHNVGTTCDRFALQLRGAAGTTVLGNLFRGISGGDAEGIDADDVPAGDPDEPGNLGTIVKNNIVRLVKATGVNFGASDGVFEGNLIEHAGQVGSDESLVIEGDDNQVLHNLIRFGAEAGIRIDASSGTLVRGNLLTRNHTSGIHLAPGAAADATLDANLITRNDGEGVSIPAGFDPMFDPAATNTTLTDNVFEDNRTDICNESDSTMIDASNDFTTGGLNTGCIVEPD